MSIPRPHALPKVQMIYLMTAPFLPHVSLASSCIPSKSYPFLNLYWITLHTVTHLPSKRQEHTWPPTRSLQLLAQEASISTALLSGQVMQEAAPPLRRAMLVVYEVSNFSSLAIPDCIHVESIDLSFEDSDGTGPTRLVKAR